MLNTGLILDAVRQRGGAEPSSTIRDFSRRRQDGTLTGGTWRKLPSGLWVITYDGTDDYISFGSQNLLVGLKKWSIVTWFKHVSGNAIITEYDAGASPFGFELAVVSSKLYLRLRNSGLDANGSSTEDVDTGEWVMAGVSFDQPTATLYVNGVADGTVSWNSVLETDSSSLLSIGCLLYGSTKDWDFAGDMAIHKAWHRALQPPEMRSIYNRTKWLFGEK